MQRVLRLGELRVPGRGRGRDKRKRRRRVGGGRGKDNGVGKLIGKGWQGSVYLSGRGGVKKVYARNILSSRRKRVAREVAALSRLRRSGVAPKLRGSGRDYLEMDYVKGRTLERKLSGAGSGRQRRYGRRTARAISRMHAEGVMHKDLHAKNVIVKPLGGVRIIDYGQSKSVSRKLSASERRRDIDRVIKAVEKSNKGRDVEPFRRSIYKNYRVR